MDKLRLDLGTLEVERLDIAVAGLGGGLEAFGMGHASTELGQSCQGGECTAETCACSEEAGTSASCNASECDCNEGTD
ncbi:MAG: hypothetical protein ACRDSR_24565 [Pseudonocardiaceae bacterium]